MRLSELISRDIKLVPVGSSKRWFRWAEHSSFVVDDQKGRWRWNTAGTYGDAAKWLEYWHGLDKKEAFKQSGGCEHGIEVRQYGQLDKPKFSKFAQSLRSSQRAISYLVKERGLSLSIAESLGMGVCSGSISMPCYGKKGELFSARFRIIKPKEDFRYWSEKGSHPILPYGLPLLKGRDTIFIVEGEIKSASVLQYEFDCIGTNGTYFHPNWLEWIYGYKHKVLIRDTNDVGGWQMAGQAYRTIAGLRIEKVDYGKSIDDWLIAKPKDALYFLKEISG